MESVFLRSSCSEDVVIQTDASGSWGCAAFCENKWLQWQWPSDWVPVPIMAKELVPILLSCAVWGPVLKKKSVLFQCDNIIVCPEGFIQGHLSHAVTALFVVFHSSF